MVESQDHQSDEGAEDDVDSVQQEARCAFLDRDHIEEAVHQFRALMLFQNLQRNSRESKGQIGRQSYEDAALDQLHRVFLSCPQNPQHSEQEHEEHRQYDESLDIDRLLSAEGEIVDDGIGRQRGRQVEDSRNDRQDEDDADFLHLRPQQCCESMKRTGMGWLSRRMCVSDVIAFVRIFAHDGIFNL